MLQPSLKIVGSRKKRSWLFSEYVLTCIIGSTRGSVAKWPVPGSCYGPGVLGVAEGPCLLLLGEKGKVRLKRRSLLLSQF